jgi:F-box protein 9
MESSSGRTEAELEQFRQQWREEVSARNKKPTNAREAIKAQDKTPRPAKQRSIPVASSSTAKRKDIDYSEELEPRAYHDLPDKDAQLKLGVDGQDHDRNEAFREPESALEHYERAVERETQGNLGESIRHYRIAFKVRLSFLILGWTCYHVPLYVYIFDDRWSLY